ncbi:hypothetical protein Apa02nite_090320 [Actinoplanes palleronii]|uniref:Uncharacterized protein n=1 Tax=Actinoplanes palleronii TaxID=113570 RepID=A0ABQ4BQG9_9ACTN|nr:hypothetical protein Apa02nite_090320 [Actinoplanes palleronii]
MCFAALPVRSECFCSPAGAEGGLPPPGPDPGLTGTTALGGDISAPPAWRPAGADGGYERTRAAAGLGRAGPRRTGPGWTTPDWAGLVEPVGVEPVGVEPGQAGVGLVRCRV